MSAIPGNLDTDQQPPMTVPLRHFVVGLGFLLLGALVGTGLVTGTVAGLGRLAHVHLLLAGWICVTIMGAMTQFVPVWSGTDLHSQRLASLQLVLVTTGLIGFALGFLFVRPSWLLLFGTVLLAGFWTFVYNISRTLAELERYDVTERHFLLSLLFFLALTALGLVLAANFSVPVLASVPVSHANVLGAHATLAVFGAILTTVYGALYQLGTMFTQTELHGVDKYLQSIEELGHPLGVVMLASGRLTGQVMVARIGGLLLLGGALAFGLVLARKLYEMQVEWTPMHSRYTVVVPALLTWAVLSIPAWTADPTARDNLFGAPGTVHLLLLGVIGFVVLGTLYHIVPFIIWVHRYSDLLGFEDVPMVDDLYSDRLAATDFTLVFAGGLLLFVAESLGFGTSVVAVGGLLVSLGVIVFITNMLLVIHEHSPHSIDEVVLGSFSPRKKQVDTAQQS